VSIIDAHHHLWDLAVRDQDWITGPELAPIRRNFGMDDLRPLAAAAGVDATIVVQTVTVAEETPELLALAASDPLVAGVVGWTDLTAPDVADTLARLRALPGGDRLVGIRHQVQGEPDPDWLRRSDVLRGLRAVAAAGLAYDLLVLPQQLPAAVHATDAVPELTFVLDHAGKPPIADAESSGSAASARTWEAGVRALAARPNAVCKLSGLVTEAAPGAAQADFVPFARVVLDAFGPGRMMFGSDWPVCLLAADYPDVLDLATALVAGLDEAERAAVFATTAARVYLDGEVPRSDGGTRGTH
jgi:L-fuconolactonase